MYRNTNPMFAYYPGICYPRTIHLLLNSSERKLMAEKYPKLSTFVLDEESITLALNEEYVQCGQVVSLADGDTIALIPPISGG